MQKSRWLLDLVLLGLMALSTMVSLLLVLTGGVEVTAGFWIGVALLLPAGFLLFWRSGRWSSYAVLLVLLLAAFNVIKFSFAETYFFVGNSGAGEVSLGNPFWGTVLLAYALFHLVRVAMEQRNRKPREEEITHAREEMNTKVERYKKDLRAYSEKSLRFMLDEPQRFEPEAVEAAKLLLAEKENPASE